MSYRCEVCSKTAPAGCSKQVYKGVALCPKCMQIVRDMEAGVLSSTTPSQASVASKVAAELIAMLARGESISPR